MHRATMPTMLALLSIGTAFAQDDQLRASPAYAVGRAHAMLLSASPCFPRGDGGRELEALLNAGLARIRERPEYEEGYQRGMTETQRQQRFIRRSDPVACNEISLALRHFALMNEQRS